MKAFTLVKNGTPENSFELRDYPMPKPTDQEVLIESEAFGINFADIMARKGLYQDCPPLPTVIGYENVGRIIELGADAIAEGRLKVGDRVIAFTRFNGYATHVVSDYRGVANIGEEMDAGVATALATQYGTAYYAAEEMVRIHPGDNVLVQAAAGGVGTALVQLAKRRGATVFGTAGSQAKLDYLKEQGVDYPINYRTTDFKTAITKLGFAGKIDVFFDSLGGGAVKNGFKLLNSGGRLVLYGAAAMTDAKTPFGKIGVALGFGIWSPIELLMSSKSITAINMLRIGDDKPEMMQRCMEGVVDLVQKGELNPVVSKSFSADELPEAHSYVEQRKSMGKVVVRW